MVDAVSFKTRARTIDHLGREQIADCPTAVSELWKNAYDAYATTIGLHIYDGELPTVSLVDNGHGMSRQEFIDKWLVIGTESKASGAIVEEADRKGLPIRPKQGQKGIGRLSSAFLGPLLLVVSKRKGELFTAALIDWRLFENPFLFLQDIEIPVVEFSQKEEVFSFLPSMFESLRGNLTGNGKDPARSVRVTGAWSEFDRLEASEGKASTRQAMEHVVSTAVFNLKHFDQWPLWQGESDSGTILLISDIVFDLEAQLDSRVQAEDLDAAIQAKERLFQTLSNFTDPYSDEENFSEGYGAQEFNYSVTAWDGALRRSVISNQREFDVKSLEELEHVVEGTVDELGVFTGRVKAFGRWLDGEIVILPKNDISNRSNSKVGEFHLRLGTFQQIAGSSSHPPEVHRKLLEQSIKYGGVMVYRNGLRVMPYGREDSDFFEIEKRRSLHAGRHFWSNRRTFGRVALTREGNPNLKDKAGREGLIDNKSVKVFRDLVENILIKTAYSYFGTGSEFQLKYLPAIKESRAKEKAEEERNKARASRRKHFRVNLKKYAPALKSYCNDLEGFVNTVREASLSSEDEVTHLRDQLQLLKNLSKDFTLGESPRNLGTLEQEYEEYRYNQRQAGEILSTLESSLSSALMILKPKSPRDIVYSDINSNAAFLQVRLRKWNKEARDLLDSEQMRIANLYEECSKRYHSLTLPLLDDVENNRISLVDALSRLAKERDIVDSDNSELFEPYISAIRSLQENIDLETLVVHGLDAVDEMREELDRLHSLAQLGITVEIIGHEIEGLELAISEGLDELPLLAKSTKSFSDIKVAHEMLADRLRFLSPLKLSGPTFKDAISGQQIMQYVNKFFGAALVNKNITIGASERFKRFTVFEQPARIYPVFINLINNSIYWVGQKSNGTQQILLDVVQDKVVIGDSGPGVDVDDNNHLFSLFFTRKVRGGRGVGLYLCRANLAAGGHTINYAVEDDFKILPGANFVMDFKGAVYE